MQEHIQAGAINPKNNAADRQRRKGNLVLPKGFGFE